MLKQKRKRIKRGDIHFADLSPAVGSEQNYNRPVIVVQNDVGNKYSPTIVVVPLTCSLNKRPLPTHVFIPKNDDLGYNSIALTEQIRTIDRSRIFGYIGRITTEQQSEIDSALAICVGIDETFSKRPNILSLCLCSRCERNFIEGGYILSKKGWQDEKKTCDFCGMRLGLIFGLFCEKGLLQR